MDLNRETAMRLWNKSFGKETKVSDFTGRIIVKCAYNDRGSDYGWNVDHILPQSRGGKTADHNLVCCHILTNDEKADRFPAFKANGINFEIIKVENHYEIRQVEKGSKNKNSVQTDDTNLMDSASGVRFFKNLKGVQNKPRWVGSVLVRLQNVSNTAVIDFIEKLFDKENVSYAMSSNSNSWSNCMSIFSNVETRIVAVNYDMPLKEDISVLLDKCILLNTYIGSYFVPMDYVKKYDICYQVNYFKDKQDVYLQAQTINFEEMNGNYDNSLFINELVYINTEAKTKEPDLDFTGYDYQAYAYSFTRLANNLKKEVGEG